VVSSDHTYITRTQYTFLAWLGDVGALLDALQKIAGIIVVGLLKIRVLLENDLLSSIFRMRVSKSDLKITNVKFSYCGWLFEKF